MRLERTANGDDEDEDEDEEKLEAINTDVSAVECGEIAVLFGSMLGTLCMTGVFLLQRIGMRTPAAVWCGMLSR